MVAKVESIYSMRGFLRCVETWNSAYYSEGQKSIMLQVGRRYDYEEETSYDVLKRVPILVLQRLQKRNFVLIGHGGRVLITNRGINYLYERDLDEGLK